jgi:hypothetical protein
VEETLLDFVDRVSGDKKADPVAQQLAGRMSRLMRQGVVPSLSEIKRLRVLTSVDPVCGRLAWDGSCAWLRQTGAALGLPVAPAGERAMCAFPKQWTKCPGYTRREVSDET